MANNFYVKYDKLLSPIRVNATSVLEVGINKLIEDNDNSLMLWSEYFKNAKIHGVDVLQNSRVIETDDERIVLHKDTNGYDPIFIKINFIDNNIKFDFILDNCSCTLDDMIKFINLYSKVLKDDGILIVKNIQNIDWIRHLRNNTPFRLKPYINTHNIRSITDKNDDFIFTIDKQEKPIDKPVYIYLHICTIGSWLNTLEYIITTIKESKLYDIITKIRCFVLGDISDKPKIFNDDKIEIVKSNTNRSLYERFTLNNLYDDCCKDDFYVLYLHTKGITHPGHKSVQDWVDYLLYFNTAKHKDFIRFLEGYDTVGVNLNNGEGRNPYHYSGNFWWSKSSHIKSLNRKIGERYTDPEFWVTTKSKNCHYLSLWDSKINHYYTTYPKERYVSKDYKITTIDYN